MDLCCTFDGKRLDFVQSAWQKFELFLLRAEQGELLFLKIKLKNVSRRNYFFFCKTPKNHSNVVD